MLVGDEEITDTVFVKTRRRSNWLLVNLATALLARYTYDVNTNTNYNSVAEKNAGMSPIYAVEKTKKMKFWNLTGRKIIVPLFNLNGDVIAMELGCDSFNSSLLFFV